MLYESNLVLWLGFVVITEFFFYCINEDKYKTNKKEKVKMNVKIEKTKRAAFVVYDSVWDTLLALPKDKRDIAMWKIINYGILGEYEKDDSIDVALLPILTGIATQKRRYRNIHYMNLIIDEVYRRFVYISDKSGLLVTEKVLNALKKIVVECQKQDLTLGIILSWVQNMLVSPTIKIKLDYYTAPGSVQNGFFETMMWKKMEREAVQEINMMRSNNNLKIEVNDDDRESK
jgi:hypothetical protein